ncbi:XrtV sorting system accessory protein [Sphingobium sp. BS19]|uniref:XrtV sorting system accessory protein n=1 Tax=Sphingobium sp. BS19 TaxID=3018973 RepID=UPI00248F632B
METVFDWLTVAIFAGLAVLFLQRSMMDKPSDNILQYVPAAIGCACANWLGNHGYTIAAVLLCAGVLAYIIYILKPFTMRS